MRVPSVSPGDVDVFILASNMQKMQDKLKLIMKKMEELEKASVMMKKMKELEKASVMMKKMEELEKASANNTNFVSPSSLSEHSLLANLPDLTMVSASGQSTSTGFTSWASRVANGGNQSVGGQSTISKKVHTSLKLKGSRVL